MDSNKTSKQCPACKEATMFDIDGTKYFCNNCMFETPIENYQPNAQIQESKSTDQLIDPEILVNKIN